MSIEHALRRLRAALDDDGFVTDGALRATAIEARDDITLADEALVHVRFGAPADAAAIAALNQHCLKTFENPLPSALKKLYAKHDGIDVCVQNDDPRETDAHYASGVLPVAQVWEELDTLHEMMDGRTCPIVPFHRVFPGCWHGFAKQTQILSFSLDGLAVEAAGSLSDWLDTWQQEGFGSLDSGQDFEDWE